MSAWACPATSARRHPAEPASVPALLEARMRIVSVVGTRPQLIKAAALQPALREAHDEVFVDTGQHWDDAMAGAFFRELDLARPDHALGAGGGSHAEQLAAMLLGLERVLVAEHPDAVLVYGDTNSTLAGAIAAAKLGIPIAHVEAGLRSFDRSMPEEVNRVVVDHLSTWLLAPTAVAVENLEAEGIRARVALTGDLMQDLAARMLPEARDASALADVGSRLAASTLDAPSLQTGGFLFATIHRQENREPGAIATWIALLDRLASPDQPVVLAIHPGTRAAMDRLHLSPGPHVAVVEPQGYRTSLTLQLHAAAVITDSGGIQREAAWLGVPCLVLRSSTEWADLVSAPAGGMALVGLDADRAQAVLERLAPRASRRRAAAARLGSATIEPAGAAQAILRALEA